MAKYVYVQDFGNFHKGDEVDVPDGAKVPTEFLVPVAPVVAPDGSQSDAAESARLAAIAEAEKNLAALEAAEANAHDGGK
jgi:hypothetical protein